MSRSTWKCESDFEQGCSYVAKRRMRGSGFGQSLRLLGINHFESPYAQRLFKQAGITRIHIGTIYISHYCNQAILIPPRTKIQ
jgi:hypothetical protein